jgi:metallo-beta-lactamase class B
MSLKTLASGLELLASLIITLPARSLTPPAWTEPIPPFRIAGNLYYVGSADLASYLIATPDGLILINCDLRESVPLIEQSVEKLGFRFRDIRIVLISHAHYDHCGGCAEILKRTGAKYYVMEPDVPVVESGGRADFQYGSEKSMRYPPAHVDRVLRDGDTVRLGETVLTAHLTAGHTKGTTTWTLNVPESGRTLRAVIIGGATLNPGYRLLDNPNYPQIAADYMRGFAVLRSLPCDLFLGAHGSYFGLTRKYKLWLAGDHNAFIDPAGYRAYVDQHEREFENELEAQSVKH